MGHRLELKSPRNGWKLWFEFRNHQNKEIGTAYMTLPFPPSIKKDKKKLPGKYVIKVPKVGIFKFSVLFSFDF